MEPSLLSEYRIKLLAFDKTRAKKFITFPNPCIGYLLHGAAEFWIDGQRHTAAAGDLIYIAAGTEYYSLWTGDPQVQWYSVSFAFRDPLSYSDYRFQILKNYPVGQLNEMYETFEGDPLRSLSAFYALLSDLYGRMERSDYVPEYGRIRPAVKYLQAHYTAPVRVCELAAMCGYSEAHFYTLFQKLMHLSPLAYKNGLLVQHAIRALSDTQDSIEQIATQLGLSSANYFCRLFAKATGKTPAEFRRYARRPSTPPPVAEIHSKKD